MADTPEDAAELPLRLFRSLPRARGRGRPARHPGDRPVGADWLLGSGNIRLARVQPTWRLRESKGGGRAVADATAAVPAR